jgi:hypothetical protein
MQQRPRRHRFRRRGVAPIADAVCDRFGEVRGYRCCPKGVVPSRSERGSGVAALRTERACRRPTSRLLRFGGSGSGSAFGGPPVRASMIKSCVGTRPRRRVLARLDHRLLPPAANSRNSRSESRRSVLTRSPGARGIDPSATTRTSSPGRPAFRAISKPVGLEPRTPPADRDRSAPRTPAPLPQQHLAGRHLSAAVDEQPRG